MPVVNLQASWMPHMVAKALQHGNILFHLPPLPSHGQMHAEAEIMGTNSGFVRRNNF